VSAIRFYQISTSGQVIQEGTYGADRVFYFFPAVMPDARGSVFMVYSRCSPAEYAGIYYTGRRGSTPAGRFQSSARLQAGRAGYQNVFAHTDVAHWGDFNGISWDPADGSIWIFSQYATSSESYGLRVGKISYP